MPDAYGIYDGKFLQEYAVASAVNALSVASPTVPADRVWTIFSASYYPNVAETKTVYFAIHSNKSGLGYPISIPMSIALSIALYFPALLYGDEMKLWPGEYLFVLRDSATAGSAMQLNMRYIDVQIPLYREYEAQRERREMDFRSMVSKTTGGARVPGSQIGGRTSIDKDTLTKRMRV